MEQVNFTIQNNYKIAALNFDWVGAKVEMSVVDAFGKVVLCTYLGQEATILMNALNVSNFSTKSLHKSVLEYLIATGKIPNGTIEGTP